MDNFLWVEAYRPTDVKSFVALKNVDQQLDQLLIIVDDENLSLATFQSIRRDAVFLHELKQQVARNPAEAAPWNPKTLQSSIVKAANDRLLTYFTNLGSLSSRENRLCRHGKTPSFLTDG